MRWTLALLLNWLKSKTTAEKHRQLRVDGLQKSADARRRKRPRR